jgi:hypothetical protein
LGEDTWPSEAPPFPNGDLDATTQRDEAPLDARAQQLIRERIESFEQIEALVLLRSGRARSWSASEVAKHLNVDEWVALVALRHLERSGLVEHPSALQTSAFRYRPRDQALEEAGTLLTLAYAESPLTIVRLVSARSIERLRTRASLRFAEVIVPRKPDGS